MCRNKPGTCARHICECDKRMAEDLSRVSSDSIYRYLFLKHSMKTTGMLLTIPEETTASGLLPITAKRRDLEDTPRYKDDL